MTNSALDTSSHSTQANFDLELACKVGCLPAIQEALTEHADTNCFSGSPLFLAIRNRDRQIISLLLENGAEHDLFLSKKEQRLLTGRPQAELIEKMLGTDVFDRHHPNLTKLLKEMYQAEQQIQEQGLNILFAKKDWDEVYKMMNFLNIIAAQSKFTILGRLANDIQTEHGYDLDDVDSFLSTNAEFIRDYTSDYLQTGESVSKLTATALSRTDD